MTGSTRDQRQGRDGGEGNASKRTGQTSPGFLVKTIAIIVAMTACVCLSRVVVTNTTAQTDSVVVTKGQGSTDTFRSLRISSTSDASPESLLDQFQRAKQQLMLKLIKDYGDSNVEKIFYNRDHVSRGRTVFKSPSGKSRERLVRKILQKLLKSMLSSSTETFVWSTGGHSSAAGHGNFYNTDSYTVVMERAAKPIFQAVGLDFHGKNYAMGGTKSSPEVASCLAEIFGLDTDVISWDFGMTDGSRDPSGISMYCGRAAGTLPHSPACVGIHVNNKWVDTLYTEQESRHGMSIFYMDNDEESDIQKAVPDTFGLSGAEIEAMPKYVKALKCGNAYEHGEPSCGEEKWNLTLCEVRKYKTSWHPGWKVHALEGNMMGLFVIDLLEDALMELKNNNDNFASANDWIQRLQALDAEDHQMWLNAEYTDESAFDYVKSIADDIDHRMIMKSPTYCHTGRLPAETRFLGILTENTKQTGFDTFEEGVFQNRADAVLNDKSPLMRLVRDNDSRQPCRDVLLEVDYKDYFYVNYNDGEKKVIIPNDMERAYYGTNKPIQGYVMFCMAMCDWGRCPEHHIPEEKLLGEQATMTINGVAVTDVTEFGHCKFAKHAKGHRFPVNSDGRMEISAKVVMEKKYLRFSSFVVW